MNEFVKRQMFPVVYVDTLPDVHLILRKISSRYENPMAALGIFMCIHKLIQWSYEEEWRVLYYTPPSMESIVNTSPISCKGELIDFAKPTKIILGVKIIKDHEDEIVKVATHEKIKITQMRVTLRGLEETPLNDVQGEIINANN